MSKISKPFAVGTEGQTVDGRVIKREWIEQMAKNYDPKVYTANANLEHLLSLSPDSTFSAYGQVVALSTRETEILGDKKLQLMAVVKADDAIVAMQSSGKKAFASMEVAENFASKGFAYLTGLAFTDTPASLGTETMKFSAARQNVYSFGGDGEAIEWEDPKAEAKEGESLFAKVKSLLTGRDKKDDERFADTGQAIEAIAKSQRDLLEKFGALADELKASAAQAKAAAEAANKTATEFAAFKAEMDEAPASERRSAATGGNGAQLTDF